MRLVKHYVSPFVSIMKKIILLKYIFFLLFVNGTYAQDVVKPKHHQFFLSYGLVTYTTKDKILSSLTYSGNSTLFDFRYSYLGNIHNHCIRINLDKSTLESSITRNFYLSANYINATIGNLEYKYLRKLKVTNFKFYAGILWSNYFNVKEQFFMVNSSEIGLDMFSSLNVAVAIEKKYNEKHQIQLHASYSVIAYILGQMYSPKHLPENFMKKSVKKGAIDDFSKISVVDFLSSGEFLSLNRFIDFKSEFIYQYTLSHRFDLVVNYLFRFYQYKKYLKVQYGTNQLLIGFILKI